MINKRIIAGVGACVVTLTASLTACGAKANEHKQDAPRDGRNNDAALIINMPDGFANLATKCVGDIRYTVIFHNNDHYGSVATVVDPACGR